MPSRTLTIGTVSMGSGSGVVDAFGVRWILEGVDGWEGSPSTTGEATQRVGADGAWLNQAFRGPRVITVTGSVGGDWATTNAAMRRLAAVVPASDLTTMTITGAGQDMQSDVRQGGDLLVNGTQAASSFSLSLVAPDPRRYSVNLITLSTGLPQSSGGLTLPVTLPLTIGATTTSGLLSITNDGNATTRPLLTLTGPTPAGVRITHRGTGRTLYVPEAVPAGRTLVLDADKRRALLDGTAPRLVTGTWFDYAPGVNEVSFTAPTYISGALLTSAHRSAWR